MKLKTGYSSGFKPEIWLKISIILFFLFLITDIQETRSNVRPDVLSWKAFPADVYNFTSSGTRNFSTKDDIPRSPFSAHHPFKTTKPQSGSEKCFIQESFRVYADKGQDPTNNGISGIFTGYPNNSVSIIYCDTFVYISSKTGESARIRPPPITN